MPSIRMPQVVVKYIVGDLATMLDTLFDRLPEVEPDVDPRKPILLRGLREAGEEALHRRRIVASTAGRQSRAAGGKSNVVRVKEASQDSCGCRTGNGVS